MFVIQHQNNYHQIVDLLNEHEYEHEYVHEFGILKYMTKHACFNVRKHIFIHDIKS